MQSFLRQCVIGLITIQNGCCPRGIAAVHGRPIRPRVWNVPVRSQFSHPDLGLGKVSVDDHFGQPCFYERRSSKLHAEVKNRLAERRIPPMMFEAELCHASREDSQPSSARCKTECKRDPVWFPKKAVPALAQNSSPAPLHILERKTDAGWRRTVDNCGFRDTMCGGHVLRDCTVFGRSISSAHIGYQQFTQ